MVSGARGRTHLADEFVTWVFNLPVGATLFDFQLQPISIGGSFHASVECNLSILFIMVFNLPVGANPV